MNHITAICRQLRNNATEEERFLWRSLRKRYRGGVKFLRQYPVRLRTEHGKTEFYVADFYCHEARLIVEVDGGYHQNELQQQDDALRDKLTSLLGLTTLRFTNREVMNNITYVLNKIDEYLKYPPLTPP